MISLRLGEQCNLNCNYCDYSSIKYIKSIDFDLFKYNSIYVFEFINKHKLDYSITGGEPGLIDKKIYDHIFSLTNIKSIIATNGLFLKNGLFERYTNNIGKVLYHCVEELRPNANVEIFKDDRIEYIILLHKNNINYLHEFLNNNENIRFTIKLVERRNNNKELLLNKHDLKKLLRILIKQVNIDRSIIGYIHWFLQAIDDKSIQTIRSTCSKMCFTPQIDFVHNLIRKCYKSYTMFPTTDLNKFNLIRLFKNEIPEFHNVNSLCKDCTYLFNFININQRILNRLRFKRNI